MVKKILFTTILLLSIASFSQEKAVENLVASPNPFTTETSISFVSNQEQGVFLIVKNVLGKTVFKKGYYAKKGKKTIIFNRGNLKSGMYIYTIQSNREITSKRFVIK